jgi:hypothetical protein
MSPTKTVEPRGAVADQRRDGAALDHGGEPPEKAILIAKHKARR